MLQKGVTCQDSICGKSHKNTFGELRYQKKKTSKKTHWGGCSLSVQSSTVSRGCLSKHWPLSCSSCNCRERGVHLQHQMTRLLSQYSSLVHFPVDSQSSGLAFTVSVWVPSLSLKSFMESRGQMMSTSLGGEMGTRGSPYDIIRSRGTCSKCRMALLFPL